MRSIKNGYEVCIAGVLGLFPTHHTTLFSRSPVKRSQSAPHYIYTYLLGAGLYVTEDIDEEYLQNLERSRSDSEKMKRV